MGTVTKPIEDMQKYLWLAAPYFVAVGLLYLWAYWSSFGINILEYAALSDVVKVAIIPVGSAFIFIFLGFVIAEFGYINKLNLPPGEGKNTWIGKLLNKLESPITFLYWLSLILLLTTSIPNRWIILPVWGMIPLHRKLRKTRFLSEIGNDSVRSLLIATLVILPMFSFCQGKANAEKILNNTEYLYIKGATPSENMKYLGYINQLTFMITQDNQQIRIAKLDKNSIDLLKYKKKVTESEKTNSTNSKKRTTD